MFVTYWWGVWMLWCWNDYWLNFTKLPVEGVFHTNDIYCFYDFVVPLSCWLVTLQTKTRKCKAWLHCFLLHFCCSCRLRFVFISLFNLIFKLGTGPPQIRHHLLPSSWLRFCCRRRTLLPVSDRDIKNNWLATLTSPSPNLMPVNTPLRATCRGNRCYSLHWPPYPQLTGQPVIKTLRWVCI